MTRHLRLLFVAMLTIACSLVGKAAEGDTYKLVTDASELKSGDIVVIASKDKAVAMGAPNDKKEKYQPVTGIKITDNVLAYKEGFTELLLEGEAGKWYFKYENGYIYANSTTSTVLSFDTNKKKSANISISNGNASIGFDIFANSKYLSYSTKTSNFGYYNSNKSSFGDHGVSVQIYKKQRRDNGLSISTNSVTTTTADLDGTFHSYVTLSNPNNLSPITYKSSNTGVAEVNEQGEVKVNKSGETTITVSYAGNDTYTQAELSYTLTINKLENELAISATSATTTTTDLDGAFHSYVTLANPNNLSPITYKSSNTGVAEVNEQGEVKVNKSGETTITVSYAGNDTYTQAELSYTLTINKLANGIAIDKTSVEDDLNGYNGEAKKYVSLTNPNNLPITYTSSNPYVATVDESGNVKLVSWGKTTITVSYTGSEVYESATTSYELNVINSETSYDEKFIVFAAGTDKGSNSTILGGGDKLSKENVTIQSTWAGFKNNPYNLYAGSTTTISTTKGRIVRIEMLGCGHLDIVNSDKGTFDKGKSDAVWTGSEKSVNFQTNSGTTTPTVSTFRIYVEYPNVKTFEYNENEANNIEAWENSDITLNRTIVADKWNTLCVPFAISEEEIKANFGEGTLVEKLDAVNGNTVNFADATSIEAGVPYLIKPTVAGTTYTFNGKEVSADAPKVEGNADVTFQGIYSPTDITNNGTVKAAGVTKDGKVLFVNAGSQTNAFRCFFTLNDNATISPAMLKISIKGVETAINSIVMDNSNATDNAIYNLQGQRVNGNSLTKGIYIKNGKKFAVK